MLENYRCAARMNILLQGMAYVTDQAVYFYSPFNNKTIFGHGTKIRIPYSSIRLVKKESTLVIFPNAIRFVLKTHEEIVLASFVSRDTCYSLILRQFAIAGNSEAAINSLSDRSTVKSRAIEAQKQKESLKLKVQQTADPSTSRSRFLSDTQQSERDSRRRKIGDLKQDSKGKRDPDSQRQFSQGQREEADLYAK